MGSKYSNLMNPKLINYILPRKPFRNVKLDDVTFSSFLTCWLVELSPTTTDKPIFMMNHQNMLKSV